MTGHDVQEGPAVTRTARSTLAAIVGLVAVAVLAGCGADNPGAAVTVGDQRVSTSDVADAVSQVQSELGSTPFNAAKVTSDTVTRLARELIVAQAASQKGVVVTDSQVEALLTTTAQSQGGAAAVDQALLTNYSVPAAAVPDYARTYLLMQGIAAELATGTSDKGQQAMMSYLGQVSTQLDTSVAPRYGTWDAQTLALGPVPDDLSSPVSSPSAAASP